jgi:YD repeat-containing protein
VTDREKAGLRGPVKTCVEEIVQSTTDTTSLAFEYAVDGRLLTCLQTIPDGSQWITTYTYDSDGRLTEIVSGKVGDPTTASLHTFNEGPGRAPAAGADGKVIQTNYLQDEQGRKKAVKTFSPQVLEQYRDGVSTDSFWTGAENGIGVPTGGSVTTVYDERGLPIERRMLDGAGRLLSRFVRKYDANGRILEEHQILENPALLMAERLSAERAAELDDTRLEAMNKAMKSMLGGKTGTGKWYTYDSQGREIEVRDRNFVMETVTTTSYNEHGDKSEVRVTRKDNSAFPTGVPFTVGEDGTLVPTAAVPDGSSLPSVVLEPTITEYRYEYGPHGNWTQETRVHRAGGNECSTARRHVLTYY